MCDSISYTDLCSQLAIRSSRLRGKSQCYETDMEVCLDDPLDIITVENLNYYKIHNIQAVKAGGTPAKQRIATLTPTPQTVSNAQILATIQTLYAQVASSPPTIENTTIWKPIEVVTQPSLVEPTILTIQDPTMSKRNTKEDNDITLDSL